MESVIVRQDKDFGTEFLASDPEEEGSPFSSVSGLHELTPYGMLLASLGGCTAILLNSYAGQRKMPLDGVEIRLSYGRDFDEDCENCEVEDDYGDTIVMNVRLIGNLDPPQRLKLMAIAERCPIERMLQKGVPVAVLPYEGEGSLEPPHHHH